MSTGPVPQGHGRTLAAVLISQALLTFDLGSVAVGVPSIRADLHADLPAMQLVLAAYALGFAVSLVPAGRLGDLWGRRRLLLIGLGAFAVTAAVSGLAPSPAVLVGVRLCAGVAAALIAPQVLAVIQVTHAPAERPRALGLFGSMSAVGMILGQIGAGFLIGADVLGIGWRADFALELVLGFVALLTTWRAVPESKAGERHALDLGGTTIITVGLALLVGSLVMARSAGWAPWIWACLVVAVLLFVGFVRHERRYAADTGSPLLNLELFRARAFAAGLGSAFVFFLAAGPFVFLFTVLAQDGLGFHPLAAGAMFATAAVAFFLASRLGGRLVTTWGRTVIGVGGVIAAAGTLILGISAFALGGDLGVAALVPGLFVTGFGQGLMMPLMLLFTLSEVEHDDAGSVGGVFTTAQQVASAVGIAIAGLVFATLLGDHKTAGGYAHAYAVTTLGYTLVLNLLAVAAVRWLPQHAHGPVELSPDGAAPS